MTYTGSNICHFRGKEIPSETNHTLHSMQTQSEMQGWTHAAVQQVKRPEEQVSGRTKSPDELNSEVKRHIGLDCG